MIKDRRMDNSPAEILKRLAKRKLLILAVLFIVVAAGMTATFLITPKYEATMSLLVSRGRIDPQITSSDKSVDITSTAISDEEFNSELELFKSLEVIKGAVTELDLVHNQTPKQDTWLSQKRVELKLAVSDLLGRDTVSTDDATLPSSSTEVDVPLERAVNRVQGNLDVVPIKKSRVINITYTDTDPLRAKSTLEAIYRRFVELHVQINEKPEAAQVFNEQTGKFNQKLNAATTTLKNFDSVNGISGADIGTQQSLLQKQLSDAQAQINATRTEIGETGKKITSLQENIAAEPKEIQTGYVSKYVLALDRMKEELSQLEQQRTQLLQKYQPQSRFVRENQQQIDQIRKTIAEETAAPPQERSFALNEIRRRLQAELYDAQTKLAALKDRERSLTGQIAKLTTEATILNSRSIERTTLERQRSINEEAYLLYQKKARENEIGQVLNKERIMNFAIVDSPRTDGQQKNPKPAMNMLVLLLVGTLAGLTAALVAERGSFEGYSSELAGSVREIETRYDLPVLVSIPYMKIPVTNHPRGRRHLLPPSRDAVTREA
jgi:uncharacterized protein involved in exopolysaccharide biosynthesis